jgi:hypothetical protein
MQFQKKNNLKTNKRMKIHEKNALLKQMLQKKAAKSIENR